MNSSKIIGEVKTILKSPWQLDPGRTVPDLERVGLKGNHGIQLEGTVLYADMADSTKLVDTFKSEFAAEVYKAFLLGACRVISAESGDITAFDGRSGPANLNSETRSAKWGSAIYAACASGSDSKYTASGVRRSRDV